MTTMDWHLDSETIGAYRDGDVSPALAASLEAHVVACDNCRGLIAQRGDAARLASNWSAIADRIDEPRRNMAERVLVRLGLRDHIARLIVLTPTLSAAWFGAIAVVSAMAVIASTDNTVLRGDRGAFAFLVLAPVLPVLGVATAFTPRTDPAHELTAASPFSTFELLLVRTGAVLVTSSAMNAVATLAIPGDFSAAVWLLPAVGLTMTTLALARWMPVSAAAGALSAVWLAAAVVTARSDAATRLIAQYPPFRPAGQAAFLALALVASACAFAMRHSFDLRRTA